MAMLPPRKRNRVVGFFIWLGRGLVVLVLGLGLYFDPFKLDTELLANVATVLTPVLAVWALFDRGLMEWIVRQFHRAWKRVRPRTRPENLAVPPIQREATSPPDLKREEGRGAQQGDTGEDEDEEDGTTGPPVGCAVLFLLAAVGIVAAINFFGSPGRGPSPPAVAPVTGVEPTPTASAPPPGPPPPAKSLRFLVKQGDSCWKIAAECSGDAKNLDKLGPPLNAIDVTDPLCPIDGGDAQNPGETINLPSDWRSCPDRLTSQ
jgi:hypothetical protein